MTEGRGQVWLDRALILRSQAYRETSLLVDVFTEQHGRLRVLGKGVRRRRPPLAGRLRSLSCVQLSWVGRGDLPVLTAAEPVEDDSRLEGAALYCGFYLAELLLRLLPLHDSQPGVFALCHETLLRLATGSALQPILRGFELALLDALGYGLRLDRDTEGRPIVADQRYPYDPEQGAVAMNPPSAGLVHGATLHALNQGRFTHAAQLQEAKQLMRGVLQHHLDGRPLKSRELFNARINPRPS